MIQIGEVLFQPKKILNDEDDSIISITELVKKVVMECSCDSRKKLLNNILLSGGVTTMRGFLERFTRDMKQNMLHPEYIKVYGSERRYATWVGGAILSSVEASEDTWLWKVDWEER
jgi:centractin